MRSEGSAAALAHGGECAAHAARDRACWLFWYISRIPARSMNRKGCSAFSLSPSLQLYMDSSLKRFTIHLCSLPSGCVKVVVFHALLTGCSHTRRCFSLVVISDLWKAGSAPPGVTISVSPSHAGAQRFKTVVLAVSAPRTRARRRVYFV